MAHEAYELTDRSGLRTARQQPLDPVLLRLESKVVEPRSLGDQRGLVGEVGERGSTPERQRLVKRADRDVGVDGEGPLRVPQEGAESGGVQLVGVEPQAVARCVALDPVVAEGLPEV